MALPAFLTLSKIDQHNKFVDLEWQQRNRHSGPQWATLSGSDEVVAARNRYGNVEPFARNRIKLKVADGVNDYINASPIILGKRRYIATQGPTSSSVNHFYRMITSELKNPAVVVMLTQTFEAGKEKCFQYYPLAAEESPLVIPPDTDMRDGFKGEVELLSCDVDKRTGSQIRTLRLSTTADKGQPQRKEIRHLLFSNWPDFCVPEGDDRTALIELVRLSAVLNCPSSANTTTRTNGSSFASDLASTDQDNPRVIHCSAGVGRSGTFIALDYLLSLLHSGQLDNVPADRDPIVETVDELRKQRMMMVQGESQFNFLYDVLREQLAARWQAKAGASR